VIGLMSRPSEIEVPVATEKQAEWDPEPVHHCEEKKYVLRDRRFPLRLNSILPASVLLRGVS
jgi:hypothetical protein